MAEYTFDVNADPKMGFAFPFEKQKSSTMGSVKVILTNQE